MTSGRAPGPGAKIVTVLASASPARLGVLRAAGIDPEVIVSGIDEPAVQAAHEQFGPAATVAALARAKAEAVLAQVLSRFPQAVVLGCDSMLWLGGRLRGKPASPAIARAEWSEMAGGQGDLLTGHRVIRVRDGQVTAAAGATESTTIRFGSPTAAEIEAYLATGEPLQVAGALTIDGYGGWFVDGLDGDHSSVIGISLPLTRRLLAEVKVPVTELWRSP